MGFSSIFILFKIVRQALLTSAAAITLLPLFCPFLTDLLFLEPGLAAQELTAQTITGRSGDLPQPGIGHFHPFSMCQDQAPGRGDQWGLGEMAAG